MSLTDYPFVVESLMFSFSVLRHHRGQQPSATRSSASRARTTPAWHWWQSHNHFFLKSYSILSWWVYFNTHELNPWMLFQNNVFDVSSSATARRIPSLKTSPIRQKRRNRIRHPPSDRRKKNFFEFLPFSSFVKNTFMFFPSLKSEIILDLWKNWKWHFNDKVSK